MTFSIMCVIITQICPCNMYAAILKDYRNDTFSMTKFDILRKQNAYPFEPQFYYIKEGCNGVFIIRTCYYDVL